MMHFEQHSLIELSHTILSPKEDRRIHVVGAGGCNKAMQRDETSKLGPCCAGHSLVLSMHADTPLYFCKW